MEKGKQTRKTIAGKRIGAKTLAEKQKELDVIKWNDSKDGDKCGTYDYCAKCDKQKTNPCARAYFAK